MYETTVANANFIIQTQALFLAIFGYVFLKEKISKVTLTCIITAVLGIILMLGSSLTPGQMTGNLVAFIMPISFAILILIVKSFDGSTLWQILFWRSLFFIGVITIFLIFTYKGKIFSAIYKSGIPGLFGGIILSIGFASYVFALSLIHISEPTRRS